VTKNILLKFLEAETMEKNQNDSEIGKDFYFMLILGILLISVGFVIVLVQDGDFYKNIGYIIVAAGVSFVINMKSIRYIFSQNPIMKIQKSMKENDLTEITRDRERGKVILTKSVLEWARRRKKDTLKVKGVTLELFFKKDGLLHDCIKDNLFFRPETKTMQVLLLNPYSTNAITRSLPESGHIDSTIDPVDAICGHTLGRHKEYILYKDFIGSVENIRKLRVISPVKIECKIYNTLSPSFLLINNKKAISEVLIQGIMRDDANGKLYGILPKLVFEQGNSEIKDSLENHFDYIWNYDSILLDDFHIEVEEKNYEINRLFLLYNLQKSILERQWAKETKGRSYRSRFDELLIKYKELFPGHAPNRILDIGCGDGGGGSLSLLEENPNAEIFFNDISSNAIELLKTNITILENLKNLEYKKYKLVTSDMLTLLSSSESGCYSLVYANFSIIYMTKNKAVEIYKKIFDVLHSGGVFMMSLWTRKYFEMPIGTHGTEGVRPPYKFEEIPMTEDLRVIVGGSDVRKGEIRRFYKDFEELMGEFQIANQNNKFMDLENIHHESYEDGAILRVWVVKK